MNPIRNENKTTSDVLLSLFSPSQTSYLFLDQFLFRLVVILFFALYFAAFICQHRFSFTAT